MNIQQLLNDKITAAMIAAGADTSAQAMVRQSNKAQFGDYQANGIMASAKKLGKNPREFAQMVLDNLDLSDIAAKLEIAGPGFINVSLYHVSIADFISLAKLDLPVSPYEK